MDAVTGPVAPMAVLDRSLEFLGAALIAGLFWWSGIFDLLATWPDVVGYVAAKGIPAPTLAAGGATAIEILAPAALFSRRLQPFAAAVLGIYCLLTAALFHRYWTLQGDERAFELVHFLKDVALAGALMLVVARRPRLEPARSDDWRALRDSNPRPAD